MPATTKRHSLIQVAENAVELLYVRGGHRSFLAMFFLNETRLSGLTTPSWPSNCLDKNTEQQEKRFKKNSFIIYSINIKLVLFAMI